MTSIKKNYLYNLSYQLLQLFLPFFTMPYLSRILGAGGVGIYSYNFSIANYFVLFILLGLNNYGNREIAKVRSNQDSLSKVFWSIYFFQLSLGIFLSLCFVIYCFLFDSYSTIIWTMIPYVISAIFDINWFFYGLEKFNLAASRNIFIRLTATFFIFILVKTINDLWIYCLINTVSLLVAQLLMWPHLFKVIYFYKPSALEIKKHIIPNLYLFLTVISISLFKTMSKIMLGLLSLPEEVGYFEISEKFLFIPLALVNSLGVVMLPRISGLVNDSSYDSIKFLEKSLIFSIFMTSVVSFGIMGILKEFVPLFLGPGFEPIISILIILLPSTIFIAFANVIRTQYLLPLNMDKSYVFSTFLGAILSIFLNVLLIPGFGAIGTAISTLLSEIVVCSYQIFEVRKSLPIKKFFLITFPLVFSGTIMFLILSQINFIETKSLSLVFKILTGSIIFIISLTFYLTIIDKSLYLLFRENLISNNNCQIK
ncbi:oligosaccharide flippase family protein [Streptococcus suis]